MLGDNFEYLRIQLHNILIISNGLSFIKNVHLKYYFNSDLFTIHNHLALSISIY